MHRSWIAIITRLRSIDVIVRMHRFIADRPSHDLNRSISDDFIGIHV